MDVVCIDRQDKAILLGVRYNHRHYPASRIVLSIPTMSRALKFIRRRPILLARMGAVLMPALLSLALALSAWAQGGTAPPVILTDAQNQYTIAPNVEILRDPTRQLTIEDVTAPAFAERFTPNRQETPNLGITTDAVWIRFRVKNASSAVNRWLLALHEQRHGKIDLYLPQPDGSFLDKRTGRNLPFTSRDVPDREFVFYLDPPVGAEETVYLRLESVSPMIVPLTVLSTAALAQRDQSDLLFYGMFYGAMLIMAGYNLFLFASLRDPAYLYLSLFILFYSLNQGARDGLAPEYLYPNLSNQYVNELSAVLWTVFAILFTTRILETRTRVPRIHWLLIGIALLFIPWVLVHLITPLNAVGLVMIQASLILMGWAGFLVWRQGYRPARYYLLSWILFFAAAFIFILNGFALFANFSFSDKPLLAAIALAALLGSLALADRVHLLQAETEKANRELARSERKYHSLFDNSRDGVFISTRDGKLLDANPALLDFLGLVRPDLTTLNVRDLYADPADRATLLKAVDERGFIQDAAVRLRRRDGSVMDALISATPWEDGPAGQLSYHGVIRDMTAQRRIEQELAAQQAQLLQVVAEERGRLARELHDSVTQSLYSIGLYANAAARALGVGKTEIGAGHVKQIIQLALEAMVDMRALIFELRPPALERVGLASALQTRLQAVEGRAGVSVEFHSEGVDRLPLSAQTELYRIAQEALSNVVKHAHASHVAVQLDFGADCAVLEIRDDGDGIDLASAQQKHTMGLRSIAERAQKIHGALTVEGKPGQGTLVRVEVPNG